MPRRPDGSFIFSTVGDFITEEGNTLTAYCEGGKGCHHSAAIDPVKLAERIGADHSILAKDLKPYFRCSKCGSKEVSFRHGHEGRPSR